LKKTLIDKEMLVITQDDFHAELFALLKRHHYGQGTIDLYKKVARLHFQRIPMIILLTGCSPGHEKSLIAAKLADRLNMTCVIKTELVLEILSCISDESNLSPATTASASATALPSLLSATSWQPQFLMECQQTLAAMKADIKKYIQEGKSFIVEGIHISPDLLHFIQDSIGSQHIQHVIMATYRVSYSDELQHQKMKLIHYLAALGLSEQTHLPPIDTLCQNILQLDRWYSEALPPTTSTIQISSDDDYLDQVVHTIHRDFLQRVIQYDKV
jgi:2-phosphoglycerate kinase